jgi:hypothetical protein
MKRLPVRLGDVGLRHLLKYNERSQRSNRFICCFAYWQLKRISYCNDETLYKCNYVVIMCNLLLAIILRHFI